MILILLSSSGCENCSDDGEVNNLLTDTERELIPFTSTTIVNFINVNSETLPGQYDAKTNEIRDLDISNDEECFATNIENELTILEIAEQNLTIQISVGTDRNDNLGFAIDLIQDPTQRFVLLECDGIVENLENLRKEITSHGFQFTNVYVFTPCTENSVVQRILYSSENGIELIEFADDTFLRLDL